LSEVGLSKFSNTDDQGSSLALSDCYPHFS
jgi:hypothetical protein